MFCCLRKETKGLKDQAGNHKCNPSFSLKNLLSPIERESHCRVFVPSRAPQATASLLRTSWQRRGRGFSLQAGEELKEGLVELF